MIRENEEGFRQVGRICGLPLRISGAVMAERNLNFDAIIDRRNTGCEKYNFTKFGMKEDLLSLWVADMDFQISSYIL